MPNRPFPSRQRRLLMAIALAAGILSGCDKAEEPAQMPEATPEPMPAVVPLAPSTVTFSADALYPEGVDYDGGGKRFLVSSMRHGTIGQVTEDGQYSPFASDDSLLSTVGLRVDAARDRVLVCSSDPGVSVRTHADTQKKHAMLAAFKLSSGELIKTVDLGKLLPGMHFCNDIAVDGNGNAYVTDSFSPIIYKVDNSYTPSIMLNDKRFEGEGFNLNGIVVHPDGYLLVTKYNEGLVFKVPLNAPEKFSQVEGLEPMIGADGLVLNADGSLVVIANLQTNKVFKLTSTDNWVTAQVVASEETGQVFATTGVAKGGGVHVIHAMLHVLFNPDTSEHISNYDITPYLSGGAVSSGPLAAPMKRSAGPAQTTAPVKQEAPTPPATPAQ